MLLSEFARYVLPALIAAITSFITVYLTSIVTKRKLAVEDAAARRQEIIEGSAALRKDLMEERRQLIQEICDLQKRCDELEKENRKQVEEILQLKGAK